MNYKKAVYSFPEVYSKLMKYCAYQERSSFEAKNKGYDLGLRGQDLEKIVDQLIDENFINDERFAETFVRGKVKVKRWGRFKISEGLYSKGVKGKLADKALHSIDESVYLENLNYWVNYKMDREVYTKVEAPKLFRFLQSKGYEGDLISKTLKEVSLF
jgi:regulatory protein